MATLKGQNFRVLTYDSTASKYKVLGMSTNCVVTLNANADESSTKDDVGLASKPEVISKSWSIQVDTLNVVDAAAMLTAIKAMNPLTILFDEVSTTDNQTALGAAVARTGQAYINDLTLTFNDRENSAKSIQLTGSGALSKVQTAPSVATIAAGTYTKGQFVRLFLGSDNTNTPSKVIAAARQMSMHVSLTLEDMSTKDTTGDYTIQEPTGISFDISTTALMRSGETITSEVDAQALSDLEDIYEGSTPVKFQIANVSGDNQRTKGSVIVSGSVIISQLTMNGQNRANADYTAALNGYGGYTVGA
jgi:hypothetical protein